MAKYDPSKRGLDEQMLEGGGGGGGFAGTTAGGKSPFGRQSAVASVKDTKWSNMPSLKSNSNIMDDIRKIGKDTSHLKGNAKKVSEDAQDRAVVRTGVRAAGAGAVAAGAKMAASDASASDDDKKQSDSSGPAGIGEIISGKGMAKGGSVSSRADGIAQRGKTRGKMC